MNQLNQRAEQIEKDTEQAQTELAERERRLASIPTVEEYKATPEDIRSHWESVYSGWEVMEDMTYEHRKHLIDLMFEGADEDGRPYGVYIRNVDGKGKVFKYEIYGRFAAGSLFMKGDNSDYYGDETELIEAQWEQEFQGEKAARRAKKPAHRAKRKRSCLEMGGTGLEPVTSCVSSTQVRTDKCLLVQWLRF